jgi:hypothetical protein
MGRPHPRPAAAAREQREYPGQYARLGAYKLSVTQSHAYAVAAYGAHEISIAAADSFSCEQSIQPRLTFAANLTCTPHDLIRLR